MEEIAFLWQASMELKLGFHIMKLMEEIICWGRGLEYSPTKRTYLMQFMPHLSIKPLRKITGRDKYPWHKKGLEQLRWRTSQSPRCLNIQLQQRGDNKSKEVGVNTINISILIPIDVSGLAT